MELSIYCCGNLLMSNILHYFILWPCVGLQWLGQTLKMYKITLKMYEIKNLLMFYFTDVHHFTLFQFVALRIVTKLNNLSVTLKDDKMKWVPCIYSNVKKSVFMPPPFEEWWSGIKCYSCPWAFYKNIAHLAGHPCPMDSPMDTFLVLSIQ